jgi:ribose 1,5-bisphosphokinase
MPQSGSGRLVLVLGASGVGKDALIAGARDMLIHDPRFVFPERTITRPAHAAEKHASLSEDEFFAAAREGRFALTWEAHGLHYGVPASIDAMIASGQTIVLNASRSIGAAAQERYPRVCLVLIECPLDVRAARLAQRGREDGAAVEARLTRRVAEFNPIDVDVRIDNSGALKDGVRALVEVLKSLAEGA